MPETRLILLAEDDDNDVLLVQSALREAGVLTPVHVVRDGDEAILYLTGVGKYANRAEYPLPSLLLLDLKMPCKNGFEVLQWIRSEPNLRALRVIVLTGSTHLHDLNKAYQFGANSFLVKPSDFKDLIDLFKPLHSYWLVTDQSPEIARPDGEIQQILWRKDTGSV